MADKGHKETDKILHETEKTIKKEYARATKEVQKKLDDYMAQFEDGKRKLRQMVDSGEATEKQYQEYVIRKTLTGQRWEAMRDVLAADYHNANQIAMQTVMGNMPEVYAVNHDFATYQLEHDGHIDTSYTLYNHDAAERLIRSPQQLLPKPAKGSPSAKAAANKDLRWNAQKIQSEMLQGVLQGENYHQMARRLQRVTDMNEKAAIRNARTMTTNVQNAGRMAAYERAAKRGVNLQKEWVATLDNVTRDSHVDLHGERVDIDKPFSNGLDYPGGAGEPAEVYNCRCTMIAQIKGYETDTVTKSPKMGRMSYEEWKGEKEAYNSSLRKDIKVVKRNKIPNVDNEIRKRIGHEEDIRKTLHEHEIDHVEASVEVGTVISPTGELVGKYIGTVDNVNIPAGVSKGNIVTHNHPYGRNFSPTDINTMLKSGAIEVRATCTDGTVVSLKRIQGFLPNPEIVSGLIEATSDKKIKEHIIEYRLQGAKDIREMRGLAAHNYLKNNAERYGLRYSRGEI